MINKIKMMITLSIMLIALPALAANEMRVEGPCDSLETLNL